MLQLYEDMKQSLKQLERLSSAFHAELKNLPEGSLSIDQRKGRYYYYHCVWKNGTKRNTYLRPSRSGDAALIDQLKRGRFIRSSLPRIDGNIKALSTALKTFRPYNPKEIEDRFPPAYHGFTADNRSWLAQEPDLRDWARKSYQKNTSHPEGLIHETSSGIFVRSKSESMIANFLSQFQIPFRYEALLTANGNIYAPDFTLFRPRDHREMYWEHLGKMDDPDYVMENAKKLMDYRQEKIALHQNLILTFEDRQRPLTAKEIVDTIYAHLL